LIFISINFRKNVRDPVYFVLSKLYEKYCLLRLAGFQINFSSAPFLIRIRNGADAKFSGMAGGKEILILKI